MPELITKTDLLGMQQDLRESIAQFQNSLDRQARQLTIRFGLMWVAAIWFLVIILKRC